MTKKKNGRKNWTPNDIRRLGARYLHTDKRKLAKEFGVSYSALRTKAHDIRNGKYAYYPKLKE